jgi:hypothetical protein
MLKTTTAIVAKERNAHICAAFKIDCFFFVLIHCYLVYTLQQVSAHGQKNQKDTVNSVSKRVQAIALFNMQIWYRRYVQPYFQKRN